MRLAHNIGDIAHSNYNTRQEILDCTEPIGFDGIYLNVYENQDVLRGKSGIMFPMGDYLGGDNSFDIAHVPQLERYCTLAQVHELCDQYDFQLGWHSWTHRILTKLSDKEVLQELAAPFETTLFRYPHGQTDERVIQLVKRAGYTHAYCAGPHGTLDTNVPNQNLQIWSAYLTL